MLVATTLIALSSTASAAEPAYQPDPFGWPMHYVDESYPEEGIVGGFAEGRLDPEGPAGPFGVVGGEKAPKGKWPDAVGVVFYGYYVGCTGTLVASNVVVTAGHCVGGISHVVVGSTNWAKDEGEVIEVKKTVEYPNSWGTYDIAVLKLQEKSTYEPRHIALDCIIDDYLEEGAEVAVVGYGNTNYQGTQSTTQLNEGYTYVQTPDCSDQYVGDIYTGCNQSVSPGGELGAGGNEVDACFGDSGGPLYLLTPEGDFLVGVTSRAYWGVNPNYPCRDGGIYVRPDAVFDWIEESAGRNIPVYNCNGAPEISADSIVAKSGKSGFTFVEVTDDGAGFEVEVVQEPEHGSVVVHDDGELEYVSDDGYVGEDSFTVAVTDDGHPDYERSEPISVELDIPVVVEKGLPIVGGGCGCSAAGAPAGAAWVLGLVGLLGLRRRRP